MRVQKNHELSKSAHKTLLSTSLCKIYLVNYYTKFYSVQFWGDVGDAPGRPRGCWIGRRGDVGIHFGDAIGDVGHILEMHFTSPKKWALAYKSFRDYI